MCCVCVLVNYAMLSVSARVSVSLMARGIYDTSTYTVAVSGWILLVLVWLVHSGNDHSCLIKTFPYPVT